MDRWLFVVNPSSSSVYWCSKWSEMLLFHLKVPDAVNELTQQLSSSGWLFSRWWKTQSQHRMWAAHKSKHSVLGWADNRAWLDQCLQGGWHFVWSCSSKRERDFQHPPAAYWHAAADWPGAAAVSIWPGVYVVHYHHCDNLRTWNSDVLCWSQGLDAMDDYWLIWSSDGHLSIALNASAFFLATVIGTWTSELWSGWKGLERHSSQVIERLSLVWPSTFQAVYSGPAAVAKSYFGVLGYGLHQQGGHFMDFILDVMIKAPQEEVDSLVEKFSGSEIFSQEDRMSRRIMRSPGQLPPPKYTAPYKRQIRCAMHVAPI